jgi:thioredoxin reductase (NADPH)
MVSTLVLGEKPGGNPIFYDNIGNFPGFPGGVTGAQLMMGMLKQVDDLGPARIGKNAKRISLQKKRFQVFTDEENYLGKTLIVATGSDPLHLGVPGEDEFYGKGVYHCAHCDAPVFRTLDRAKATVVGGGDSAVNTALHVARYAEEVTIIHRGKSLRAGTSIQEAARNEPKIRLELGQEVVAILGRGDRVTALQLRDTKTGRLHEFPADGIFIGIGQKPNTGVIEGLVDLDGDGFIPVNARMETSRQGVFAAGDVIQKPLRQIVTAVGDGAVAADAAIRYVETNRV